MDQDTPPPVRELPCRVVSIAAATHNIRVIRLAAVEGAPIRFLAGQYAALGFVDLPLRDYSMANRPSEDSLEFHVRLDGRGEVSRYVFERLGVGERVRLRGPLGEAYLRTHHPGPMLAIAGGSGLAPVKSIVETALSHRSAQPIHLYYGVREERDVYLEEHFRALSAAHPNVRVTIALSHSPGTTARRTGFVSEVVREDFRDLAGFKAYIAGPPAMAEAAIDVALSLGLRPEDCHADPFVSEAERLARDGPR